MIELCCEYLSVCVYKYTCLCIWMFIYKLSGCGFEILLQSLKLQIMCCFEQDVPWHLGNYRVYIHSETCTWYKNIQSLMYIKKSKASKIDPSGTPASVQLPIKMLFLFKTAFWNLFSRKFCIGFKDLLVIVIKVVNKELSWMSHRVICFWFLLNFLFISFFFDILAPLSISRVFSSGFLGRPKSSCLDIPEQLSNVII